jgi:hypothetical protein
MIKNMGIKTATKPSIFMHHPNNKHKVILPVVLLILTAKFLASKFYSLGP